MNEEPAKKLSESVQPNAVSRAFWKGFWVCATIVILVLGIVVYREVRWHWSHTNPSESEQGKIAALFHLEQDDELRLSRFEYKYHPFGLDPVGGVGVQIQRTEKSPDWDVLLKDWTKLPSDTEVQRIMFLPWVTEHSNMLGTRYVRWVWCSFAGEKNDTLTAGKILQLCMVTFDKQSSDIIYLSTEGELFLPGTSISAEQTSATVGDYNRLPWHSD